MNANLSEAFAAVPDAIREAFTKATQEEEAERTKMFNDLDHRLRHLEEGFAGRAASLPPPAGIQSTAPRTATQVVVGGFQHGTHRRDLAKFIPQVLDRLDAENRRKVIDCFAPGLCGSI